MSDEKVRIAIPEGNLLDEVMPALQASGLYLGEHYGSDQEKILYMPFSEVSIRVVASQNLRRMLANEKGYADIGIVSSEAFLEEWVENWRYATDLHIARRSLSLVARAGTDVRALSKFVVATRYPLIARAHLALEGVDVQIIEPELGKSMAELLDVADALVDVIDGTTRLQQQGLVEVRRICPVSAHAMVSTHTMARKRNQIDYILDRIMRANDPSSYDVVKGNQLSRRGAA